MNPKLLIWLNFYNNQLGLSVEYFKEKTSVTDEQLNTAVEEIDLPNIAQFFDGTDLYVRKLQLNPAEQNDVRAQVSRDGTQAGMIVALNYWRSRHPVEATFRALLLMLISLDKGEVAKQVCIYLSDKCEQYLLLLFNNCTNKLSNLPLSIFEKVVPYRRPRGYDSGSLPSFAMISSVEIVVVHIPNTEAIPDHNCYALLMYHCQQNPRFLT